VNALYTAFSTGWVAYCFNLNNFPHELES